MKAALALIFFACVAGSMASSDRDQFFGQLVQEGQVMANTVFTYLQNQIFGRASVDLGAIFSGFLSEISGAVQGLGQHFLNQGLAAVLGGLGSLGGRSFGEMFAGLSQQIGAAVSAAQGMLQGVVGGLSALGSNLLDASKPHWEQLQEQLVGHGLNVLGSLSETINNLHGSITGGR
ncbi:unnamed protein product [Rotaria sordida]|uniref:Uncharacterized protein n=1 Tax=Rotaria sordida TaxID=392033 RepID=A0A814L0Z4_9BILA|nr:unnamed protein product [Rotaria sordida]